MMTLPPSPPSPPSGPPLGTNFSRRNETHPCPPSPAFTWILASSMNMGEYRDEATERRRDEVSLRRSVAQSLRRSYLCRCRDFFGADMHLTALEFNLPVLEGEE